MTISKSHRGGISPEGIAVQGMCQKKASGGRDPPDRRISRPGTGLLHGMAERRTTPDRRATMERRGMTEDEARDRVARQSPQHRIMPPEEVAEAVAFVCSGLVPSLSGSPLVLGGGE